MKPYLDYGIGTATSDGYYKIPPTTYLEQETYTPIIYQWSNNDYSTSYCDLKTIKYLKTNLKDSYGWYGWGYDTTTAGNTWRTFDGGNCWAYKPIPQKTPRERLMEMLQQRQAPQIVVAREPILAPKDMREVRARETLRLCLGEEIFRSFLKNGFVSVRAKSGLIYQIFPGHGITRVYKQGRMVERLCVVFRGNFPPADSLVMRFLLILNDEAEFRSHAVKHGTVESKRTQLLGVDDRNLVQMFREFKSKVAA